MKKLLLSLLLLVVTINVGYAQRQQTTKDFVAASFPDLPFTEIKGALTYQYIIGNNGDHILDGTYTVKCQQGLTDKSGWISYGTYKISGSYNVNTTFSNGLLNGPLTVSRKAYAKLDSYSDRMEVNCSYNLTAAFSNGVPNGTFKLTFLGDQSKKGNLTANYKNGTLVGAYSYDYDRTVYKGNFNSSGDFIGSWNFDDTQILFENGVLISKTSNGTSTKPATSAVAKKYANGQLSEDELYDLGYLVKTTTVYLSDLARNFVLDICEEPIDGRYPQTNNPTYVYLEEISKLKETGVDELIKCIINRYNANEGTAQMDLDIYYGDGEYNCIRQDEIGNYYFQTFANSRCKENYVTSPEQKYTYMSHEQFDRIQSAIDTYLQENRRTTLYGYYQLTHHNDAALLEAYFNGNTNIFDAYGSKNQDNRADDIPYYLQQIVTEETPKESSKLEHLKLYSKTLIGLLSSYKSTSSPHPRIEGYNMFDNWLIADSSETEFKEFLTKLDAEILRVQKEEMIANLTKSINWIKERKTASAMFWKGNMADAFFTTSYGNDYWTIDLQDNIKPFCPIFDIEIIRIDSSNVVVNIKKGKNEKKLTTYQITLKHMNGKFHAESFSINKAKLIQ